MSASHLSVLALEQLAAEDSDLPAGTTAHLASCAACRARLATRRAERAQWLADIDVPARIDALIAAARGTPRPRRRLAARAAAVVAVAAALVVIAMRPDERTDRRKGGDALAIFRRGADGRVDELAGEALHPGDAIRFRVSLARDGYVGILSVDAAGVITAYAPAGPMLERVSARAPVVLDDSIVLDDTLGPEQLVLVACDLPRPIAALIAGATEALASAAGDPRKLGRIAPGCREQRVLLHKAAR